MANNFYWAIALTGGGSGALDAIDGANLQDKEAAIVITPTKFSVHTLKATSGAAENSPDVIAPDTNAGLKRWHMVYMFGAIISNPASGEHKIKSIVQLAGGEWKVIYEGDAEL